MDTAAADAVLALTNELRVRNGLSPLPLNGALDASADAYAAVLAANDWFAHEGPDGSTMVSRAEAAGYTAWTYLSENLYLGFYQATAASIFDVWATSPSHLSNILSDRITEMGVACWVSGEQRWCVQELGTRD